MVKIRLYSGDLKRLAYTREHTIRVSYAVGTHESEFEYFDTSEIGVPIKNRFNAWAENIKDSIMYRLKNAKVEHEAIGSEIEKQTISELKRIYKGER